MFFLCNQQGAPDPLYLLPLHEQWNLNIPQFFIHVPILIPWLSIPRPLFCSLSLFIMQRDFFQFLARRFPSVLESISLASHWQQARPSLFCQRPWRPWSNTEAQALGLLSREATPRGARSHFHKPNGAPAKGVSWGEASTRGNAGFQAALALGKNTLSGNWPSAMSAFLPAACPGGSPQRWEEITPQRLLCWL